MVLRTLIYIFLATNHDKISKIHHQDYLKFQFPAPLIILETIAKEGLPFPVQYL